MLFFALPAEVEKRVLPTNRTSLGLFITQGLDRIETRCPHRRNHPAD